MNLDYQPVAPTRNGINVPGLVGGVSQHVTQPIYGCVQPVIEIDERAAIPKLLVKLLPAHKPARFPD